MRPTSHARLRRQKNRNHSRIEDQSSETKPEGMEPKWAMSIMTEAVTLIRSNQQPKDRRTDQKMKTDESMTKQGGKKGKGKFLPK